MFALTACTFYLFATPALAEIDLRNATRVQLDNGLTVILLEDRNAPLASVQMLYRIGARDEVTGKTGLAHFLEHMAFRSSDNFPDTGLVSEIYAVGGEWHGYTWTDQTTYYSTVPREHLGLLLRIEADRMARLTIAEADMEAERGAVLAEMHMYENSPVSMLIDAVMFTSFLAHPYRNNTIGWESDIEHLQHTDVVEFYRRHYQPANAVLAVVGDIDSQAVMGEVESLFGDVEGGSPTPLPHTVEPVQKGERWVRLHGAQEPRRFMIAYRAPSANNPDYPAFLVLQALLGTSSGVNFQQNDWGTPVAASSILYGAAENMTTWYPPSAQDYVFVIGGEAGGDRSESEVEHAVEERVSLVRDAAPSKDRLAAAIGSVLDQLVFDVGTTEDAAHQLAFFDGLGAYETLLALPDTVAAVSADEVRRVAWKYLQPERRSIAWYLPEPVGELYEESSPPAARPSVERKPVPVDDSPRPPPVLRTLSGGLPVIVQQNDTSESAYLQVILPAGTAGAWNNYPIDGYSSRSELIRPSELPAAIEKMRDSIRATERSPADPLSDDPAARLQQEFADIISAGADADAKISPKLIVVSGDVAVDGTIALLEEHFADAPAPVRRAASLTTFKAGDRVIHLERPLAQVQLGYIVQAPVPVEADAQRIVLYILSHAYEGRFGKEAISNRGLAYYADSRYRSDGRSGWITMAIGVDVEKADALRKLLQAELQRLLDEPPTDAEIAEAKSHMIGRAVSAAQSNEEIATRLASEWLWYGELQSVDAIRTRLASISREQVIEALPAFTDGSIILVTE